MTPNGLEIVRTTWNQFEIVLAERVGFEPTVDLHPRLISSQVHSTTLPPLRCMQLGEQSRISRQTRNTLVQPLILAETGLSR